MPWCPFDYILRDRETMRLSLSQLLPNFILLTRITFTSVMGGEAPGAPSSLSEGWCQGHLKVLQGQIQTRVQWFKGLFKEQSQIVVCARPSSPTASLSPDSSSSAVLLFSVRTSGNRFHSVWNDLDHWKNQTKLIFMFETSVKSLFLFWY